MPDPRQGVFETLLVIDGRPVELDAHLARLEASLEALFPDLTPPPLDVPVVDHLCGGSTTGTSVGEGMEVLRITVAPDRAEELEVRVERRAARPDSAISLHSLNLAGGLGAHKWVDRSLLDKAQAGLPANTLPLLVDRDGAVLEASRANVFVVRDGCLLTPPADGRILPGITRMRVLEVAAAVDMETDEVALAKDDLLSAGEVFLSGSVRGIEPVRALDGIALSADGDVGSVIAAELWRSWKSVQVG